MEIVCNINFEEVTKINNIFDFIQTFISFLNEEIDLNNDIAGKIKTENTVIIVQIENMNKLIKENENQIRIYNENKNKIIEKISVSEYNLKIELKKPKGNENKSAQKGGKNKNKRNNKKSNSQDQNKITLLKKEINDMKESEKKLKIEISELTEKCLVIKKDMELKSNNIKNVLLTLKKSEETVLNSINYKTKLSSLLSIKPQEEIILFEEKILNIEKTTEYYDTYSNIDTLKYQLEYDDEKKTKLYW